MSPITRSALSFRFKALLGYPFYWKQARRVTKMSPFEVLCYQEQKLRGLLAEAIANVPYYRQRKEFYSLPLMARDSHEFWRAFKDLPILDKSSVRDNGNLFRNERKTAFVSSHTTTGSTGIPLTLYASLMERARTNAAVHSYLCLTSRKRNPKVLYLSGMTKRTSIICEKSALLGDGYISIYDINKKNGKQIVEFLTNNSFDLIYGYPSAIYELAILLQYIGGNAIPLKPEAVVCTAETLSDDWASTIESVFGCKVHNFYGSQEGGHLAYTLPCGHMHVNPVVGYLEDDEDGALVTGFLRKTMPLIRYKVGDDISMAPIVCASYSGAVVTEVKGRSDERIITRDGARVGFFRNHLTKYLGKIDEFQLVQKNKEHFIINAVGDCDAGIDRDGIMEEFGRRLGYNVTVEIVFVESLPRSKRGKYRPVVVEVTD